MHDRSQPRIAIVTDSSADTPAAERRAGAWTNISEVWRAQGVDVIDSGEQSRELSRIVLSDVGASVEAPGTAEFGKAYEDFRDCERVYSLHAGDKVSPAITRALAAAESRVNVRVIETTVTGIAIGLFAQRILALADAEKSAEEIDDFVEQHRRKIHFMIVPDHFDPIGRQRLSAAVLLSGRPLLRSHEGDISVGARLRTRRATHMETARFFRKHTPADATIHLAVGHGDAAGAVDPFMDVIERIRQDAPVELVGRIGPRLMRRVGSRCVGLAWMVE